MLEGSRGNQGEGEGSDCWGGRGVFRARLPDGRSDSLHTGLRYAALLSLLPPLLCAAFLCSIHCARAMLWHAIEMIAHALQPSWSSVMLARSPVTHAGGPHWVTGLAHNSTFLHCVFSYMCPQNCDTHWWATSGWPHRAHNSISKQWVSHIGKKQASEKDSLKFWIVPEATGRSHLVRKFWTF